MEEIEETGGFEIIYRENEQEVRMSRKALEAISRYPRFIEGVFEDFVSNEGEEMPTLRQKSNALIAALEKNNITELPRFWFEAIGIKRAA